MQVADVVLGTRPGHRARGQHPAPGHRGEVGRDPPQVVQVHVRRDDLEVVEDGVPGPGHRAAPAEPGVRQRALGQAEHRAVAAQPHPAHGIAQRHRRIVDAGGERVDVHGERLPVGGGDPQPGDAGGQIGQEDDAAEPLGALLDDPTRQRPLGRERRVALPLGAEPAVRVPGQGDAEGAALHPHVVEVHQRRGSARTALPQPQHLLVVHPPVAVLDQLDHRPVELQSGQHEAAGEKVGKLVRHPNPGKLRQEHARGVPHHQSLEREIVDERA